MKALLPTIVIAAVLAGCVSRDLPIEKAAEFQPGVTTLAGAKELLGEPTGLIVQGDGTRIFTWGRVEQYSLYQARTWAVTLAFDPEGVMLRRLEAPPDPASAADPGE